MSLIVHHLGVSQSERIPWLCEELGIDYDLKLYKRAPKLAPPEYKALHPQGTAPIIQDGDVTLAESGACMEYISHKFADGKLFLRPSDPRYADFLYWWHWANGTFQPTVARLMSFRVCNLSEDNWIVVMANQRLSNGLKELDNRLAKSTYLAGDELTAADIMLVFSLTTMRNFSPYSLAGCDNVLAYLKRISERDAYQRAMKKSDPDMKLALDAEPPAPML